MVTARSLVTNHTTLVTIFFLWWEILRSTFCCCCSVAQSFLTLQPPELQHARLRCPSLSPHIHWVDDAIQPSHPLSPSSPPALNLSQHQGLFQWVISSHQVAKVLELQLQHKSLQWIFTVDFLYSWLVWLPCCPRDSQESSPALQFESISSLALSLLFGPTLTPVHDYWKNHSFDSMDLCQQSDISLLTDWLLATC